MPIKGGRMTKAERTFAKVYAGTGDKVYSAAAAGYGSPIKRGGENLEKPAIQEAIRREQLAILFQTALPAAVKCLIDIMGDAKAPAGARVSASKVVLDRTIGAPDDAGSKEPHEMTPEELAARIKQLEDVAATRARDVSIQPQGGPSTIDDAQSAQEVRNSSDIFE